MFFRNSKLLFNTIRPLNLFIIGATMYLMAYFVLDIKTTEHHVFFMYTLSLILCGAFGYFINDLYDEQTDKVNRPNDIRTIQYNKKFLLQGSLLTAAGCLAAGLYVEKFSSVKILTFLAAMLLLLWLYSLFLKSIPVIGNAAIALLSGIIPIYVIIFDIFTNTGLRNVEAFNLIKMYAFFAFFLTLLREIYKDGEDIEGDKAQNIRTVPIVLGWEKTRYFLLALSATFIPIYYFIFPYFWKNNILLVNLIIYIAGASTAMLLIWKDDKKEAWKKASSIIKFTMLAGLLTAFFAK